MPKLKKPFSSPRMQRINKPNLEKKSTLDSGNMIPIVETRNNDNQADFWLFKIQQIPRIWSTDIYNTEKWSIGEQADF